MITATTPYNKNNIKNKKYSANNFLALFILFLVFTNGLELDIGPITITPERALSFPILFLSVCLIFIRGKFLSNFKSLAILCSWIAVAFISSLISPVSDWAIKMWVALAIGVSYYFALIFINPDVEDVISGWFFSLISFLFGPFAACLYIAYVSGIGLPDILQGWIQRDVYNDGIRLKALTTEANIFGAILPILIFCSISKRDKGVFDHVNILGLILSLFFSYSRIPWLSFFIGFISYFLISKGRSYKSYEILKYLAAGCVSLFFIYAAWFFISPIVQSNENINRVGSISARFVMWSLAWEDIKDYPFLGSGIFSFSEMHPQAPSLVGSDSSRAAWISNILIAVVHDTGLIGASMFIAFIGRTLFSSIKMARYLAVNGRKEDCSKLSALIASFISIFVSSQSIPSHSLAFFWLCLAFVSLLTIKNKNLSRFNV